MAYYMRFENTRHIHWKNNVIVFKSQDIVLGHDFTGLDF